MKIKKISGIFEHYKMLYWGCPHTSKQIYIRTPACRSVAITGLPAPMKFQKVDCISEGREDRSPLFVRKCPDFRKIGRTSENFISSQCGRQQ